jgi:DNA-binding CsgD family transcriptional regulator
MLVEALVRAGAADEAGELLAEFEAQATEAQHDASLAGVARCRGLLGDDDEALAWFARSADISARLGHRFDLARTQLCHGERLRRIRRRAEARRLLNAAAEGFDHAGAALWRARALEELAATGEHRRVSEDDRYRLTPQEQQIAGLVATGMTNREVAARVFLSDKTIEAHLGRVFRKLGIRSRTALAAALAADKPREIPDSTGVGRA